MQSEAEANVAMVVAAKDTISNSRDSSTHDGSESVSSNSALTRRVTRKVDVRLLPILGLTYLFAFLDRTNIANAKLNGFEKELGMPSNGYNTALWVFFLPFVLLEVPCNIVLGTRKVTPGQWLGGIMFVLGVTSMCQGFAKSPGGLYACRIIMGAVEAGIAPGAALLLGQYYRRSEFGPRWSFFQCCALIGNAFSAFLAVAISKMNGTHGLSGWRWIFILEGIVTSCYGILIWLVLPNWPELASFLEPEEHSNLLGRLRAERGEEKLTFRDINFLQALSDWRTWIFTVVFFCADMSAASTTGFSPTILREMGWTNTSANLHVVPIYLGGAFMMVASSWLAAKIGCRSAACLSGALISTIGWAIQRAQAGTPSIRYFALFLIFWGANIQMPNTVAWLHSNVESRPKKAVAMAILLGFGNSCNFVSSNVFILNESPKFPTGFSVGLAISAFGTLVIIGMTLIMFRVNRMKGTKEYWY